MFEGKYGTYWIDGGILHMVYKENIIIDLKIAKKITSDRLLFQQAKEYPVFCDLSTVVDSTSMARRYFAAQGTTLMRAIAIYAGSPVAISHAEFYMRTLMHKIPTAFFTQKYQALKFLKDYCK